MNDKQQIGTKVLDFLRQLRVVPIGVIACQPERLRCFAQAGLEHRATRQKAVVHAEDALRPPAFRRGAFVGPSRSRSARGSDSSRLVGLRFASRTPSARQASANAAYSRSICAIWPFSGCRPVAAEEMTVGEVDADQPDPLRAQVAREVHRDVRGVVGVVQAFWIATVGAAAPAEPEAHRARVRQIEVCMNTALASDRSTCT